MKALLGQTRLLTLTGAVGSGKTRLALQTATDFLSGEVDGVWLAEPAPLADPALVPQIVARVLGVREEPGRPLTQTLAEALRPRRLLLVLDNCEHLVAACAALAADLLQARGSKSAKKHLKRIRQKQSRFSRDTNHVISNRVVVTAANPANPQSRKALGVEDLKGIRDRSETVFSREKMSQERRWLMGNWAFDQLRQFLSYKAEAAGIPLVSVDPRNTSRTCSQCGHCEKANRKSQAKFHCQRCGFDVNADKNAAVNIGVRASSSESLLSQLCLRSFA